MTIQEQLNDLKSDNARIRPDMIETQRTLCDIAAFQAKLIIRDVFGAAVEFTPDEKERLLIAARLPRDLLDGTGG